MASLYERLTGIAQGICLERTWIHARFHERGFTSAVSRAMANARVLYRGYARCTYVGADARITRVIARYRRYSETADLRPVW